MMLHVAASSGRGVAAELQRTVDRTGLQERCFIRVLFLHARKRTPRHRPRRRSTATCWKICLRSTQWISATRA
eukprot:7824627-Pyramimonas_sp.AAC.1